MRQITAGIANPPFDRSPLDGYALRAADIAMATRETPARLSVVGEVCAGGWFSGEVQPEGDHGKPLAHTSPPFPKPQAG